MVFKHIEGHFWAVLIAKPLMAVTALMLVHTQRSVGNLTTASSAADCASSVFANDARTSYGRAPRTRCRSVPIQCGGARLIVAVSRRAHAECNAIPESHAIGGLVVGLLRDLDGVFAAATNHGENRSARSGYQCNRQRRPGSPQLQQHEPFLVIEGAIRRESRSMRRVPRGLGQAPIGGAAAIALLPSREFQVPA